MDALDRLAGSDLTLIIVTHRYEEIVPSVTHVLCLRDLQVYLKGTREYVLRSPRFRNLYAGDTPLTLTTQGKQRVSGELAVMRNTGVRYGEKPVFRDINWRVRPGENWQVLGPNGCGKSTLLSLITGGNPQTYSNEIYLFGTRRGRGDSIWDVRKRIGIVSSELQIRYRKPIKAFDVILSGFYESVGMYRRPEKWEVDEAERWIGNLDIGQLAERRFDRLSFGEQRLVLIARAMIKNPDLLLLDEPCQGLDPGKREMILEALDGIGREKKTVLIFVTHHRDEVIPSLTHRLEFSVGEDGAYTARSSEIQVSSM
jgi:molybdate transport system ATP-binding protein